MVRDERRREVSGGGEKGRGRSPTSGIRQENAREEASASLAKFPLRSLAAISVGKCSSFLQIFLCSKGKGEFDEEHCS